MAAFPSRRELVIRFAAHVAHSLNSGTDITTLEDYALYMGMIDVLSGTGSSRTSDYPAGLTGYPLVQHRMSAGDAAQVYFDSVLCRKLFLARANHWHKGHELLLVLCHRGLDSRFPSAQLIRCKNPPVPFGVSAPADFMSIKSRLAKCDGSVSQGNPAATTQRDHGPLYIELARLHVELPEELSLWEALQASPRKIKPLHSSAWLDFRNLVIKAFEAANAPYAALLSVGLWPPDWAGSLSTNTVKQLSAFMTAVRARDGEQALPVWQAVWGDTRTVPGFPSAEALWKSELGSALRLPIRQHVVAFDDIEIASPEESEPSMLDACEFGRLLQVCRDGGCIDELEMWIYQELARGETIGEIGDNPRIKERLAYKKMGLSAYLGQLSARLHAFVRGREENPSR